jgi:hypothetical protein
VGEPLERIGIDILGPLPRSDKGNKYLLVISDYFTKWAEAFPMKNMEAETVTDKLIQGFITKFGVPRQIHTDQGRQFESLLFQELCRKFNIKKTRTTAYHPQSDGQVERFNRTLTDMLSKFIEENQKDWDGFVPLMTMAYRASPHETTQLTPNKMMFGREIDLPIDIMFGKPCDSRLIEPADYVSKITEELEFAYEYVRERLDKNAIRQKRYYDLKASGNELEVGNRVWLFTPFQKKGLSSKLTRKWTGPIVIIEKLVDVLFKIKRNLSNKKEKSKIIHFDHLKLYDDFNEDTESSSETSSETEDIEETLTGLESSEESFCNFENKVLKNPVSLESAGGKPIVLDSVGRNCQENVGTAVEIPVSLDWTEVPQSSGRTGTLCDTSVGDVDSVGRARQDVPGRRYLTRCSGRTIRPPRRLIEEI